MTLLGLVFLASGVSKLRRPHLVAVALVNFRAVRAPLPLLGVALGGSETLIGLLLISRAGADIVLAVSAVLLFFFAYALLRVHLTGATFPCTCFGSSDEAVSGRTALRAALLGTLALYLASTATFHSQSWWSVWPLQASFASACLFVLLLAGEIPVLRRASRHPAHGRA